MEVKQIFELVNNVTDEVLGKSDLIKEDLSNVVDVGESIFNANAYDKYVQSLVNHIGKMVFVNRPYTGSAPSVLMDAWEFGSVLEKVSTGLPEATENETWELQNGQSYDQNIFYKPSVEVKFFNKMITFEVPMSFTEKQVKQSFSNAVQLNAFLSMLYTSVENSMTVKVDGLIMRTINNFTSKVLEDGDAQTINLLELYNETATNKLTTVKQCLREPEFIRFASYMIKLTAGRMMKMSSLYNLGKQPRFTPKELMHIVLLEDFASAADVYLQSDTFHNELTSLPLSERVPYWQGPGLSYDLNDTSKIKVKNTDNVETEQSGILGVIFDRYALGVNNYERRVTSHYNAKAEFFSNWYKQDARYYNDFNENFVVFYVG